MFKPIAVLVAVLAFTAPAAAADSNRLFPDSRVVVRDRFSDEIVGEGPDLVFIPGLASSRATWRTVAESLRARYRLHLIQVAGFAGEPSRANAEGEVVKPTAEAIADYLRGEKLTPAVVIGHSLGGTMTLYLAETHPEVLKKALIVDALPFFGVLQGGPSVTVEQIEPRAAKMRDAMLAAAEKPASAEAIEPQMAQMSKLADARHMIAEWGAESDRKVVARAMYEDLTLDLRPGLAAVGTPIVLLFPDYTPVGMPAGMADRVYRAAYAPAATVRPEQVTESAHFIMIDQPETFADALDEFLAQH
ncbi:alpha/beta hydrolase [Phenylobacterium sp.]|uniref:alpha/beta fold hydrolase n=1 Tax=Phenylobacterium sp. TaxID=1871053 RepID=UPI0025FA4EED|nr:alpha/beta hydrolase [Phenylobacterium sp.]